MEKNFKKELMLKGNAVKRLIKEYNLYDKEVNTFKSKLEELEQNNSDETSIKKQKEFIQESVGARDYTRDKLRKATDDLTLVINEVTCEEVKILDEYKNAIEYLNSSIQLFTLINSNNI